MTAQVAAPMTAGAIKVFREVASVEKTARAQLRKVLAALDRLAGSTRDLLNVLAQVTERKVGFRSLADAWADRAVHLRHRVFIPRRPVDLDRAVARHPERPDLVERRNHGRRPE